MNCFPNLKKCLINSHTYNAMKNTVDMQATRTGCKYVSVDIPMPIESEDQIVDLFVQKMESEGDIDFAIIGTFKIFLQSSPQCKAKSW